MTVHETLTGVECTVTVIRIRAKLLSDGGPTMWLQAAYEKVMAKRAKG